MGKKKISKVKKSIIDVNKLKIEVDELRNYFDSKGMSIGEIDLVLHNYQSFLENYVASHQLAKVQQNLGIKKPEGKEGEQPKVAPFEDTKKYLNYEITIT